MLGRSLIGLTDSLQHQAFATQLFQPCKLFNYPTSQTVLQDWLLYEPSHKEGTKLASGDQTPTNFFQPLWLQWKDTVQSWNQWDKPHQCFVNQATPLDSLITLPFLSMGALQALTTHFRFRHFTNQLGNTCTSKPWTTNALGSLDRL